MTPMTITMTMTTAITVTSTMTTSVMIAATNTITVTIFCRRVTITTTTITITLVNTITTTTTIAYLLRIMVPTDITAITFYYMSQVLSRRWGSSSVTMLYTWPGLLRFCAPKCRFGLGVQGAVFWIAFAVSALTLGQLRFRV